MPNPTTISEYVLAVAAVVSTGTPIVMARRAANRKHDETALEGFAKLNAALEERVQRIQGDMDRMRDDYERRLAEAQAQIGELRREVATLQRLLTRRGGDG